MGDFDRAYSPYDHTRAYQEHDVSEARRLFDEKFYAPETLHEFTVENNGVTVVVFNTKVVLVQENGTVEEFARA